MTRDRPRVLYGRERALTLCFISLVSVGYGIAHTPEKGWACGVLCPHKEPERSGGDAQGIGGVRSSHGEAGAGAKRSAG
jgi:hypothetical protein